MGILINPGTGISIGADLRNSVSNLNGEDLASADTSTTLTANQSARDAFENSQTAATSFSEAITEAGHFLFMATIAFRDTDEFTARSIQNETSI